MRERERLGVNLNLHTVDTMGSLPSHLKNHMSQSAWNERSMKLLVSCPGGLSECEQLPRLRVILVFGDTHFPPHNMATNWKTTISPGVPLKKHYWPWRKKKKQLVLDLVANNGYLWFILDPFLPHPTSNLPTIPSTPLPKCKLNRLLLPIPTTIPSLNWQCLLSPAYTAGNFFPGLMVPSCHAVIPPPHSCQRELGIPKGISSHPALLRTLHSQHTWKINKP